MTIKKVLYCEGNIDGTIGGSYFSLFFLVDGLDKTRYEPTVVFHNENSLIPMYREAGINTLVFELPKPVQLTLGKGNALDFINKPLGILQKAVNFYRAFILQSLKYARYMKKHKINLLHLNNAIIRNHPWMLAALLANIKCITHERGINSSYSKMSRFFAKRLDAIVCISEAVKENMIDKGIGSENLVIIHNGVDPNKVIVDTPATEIRKQYGIEKQAPIIGIAGNIREWKGQEIVIKATKLLRDRFPNIRCFIVGDTAAEHSYYEKQLLNYVSENKLQDNVIFTGYRKNVASYFNAMDIVVHASVLPEPFGRVLIEAMALRKPLVGAGGGAVREIIQDNITGIVCEPGNVEQYATAINRLLEDKELAKDMGNKGFDRLQAEFHVKRNVEKTQSLYESLFG